MRGESLKNCEAVAAGLTDSRTFDHSNDQDVFRLWRLVDGLEIAWHRRRSGIGIMESRQRIFYTSQFARLELIAKARFHKQREEVEFYEAHFGRAAGEVSLSRELGVKASSLAARYGVGAADALHLAAAIDVGVEEFITTEKSGKPMFRVSELRVISLEKIAI